MNAHCDEEWRISNSWKKYKNFWYYSTNLLDDNEGLPYCAGSVDNLCTGRAVPGSSGVPYSLPAWINLTLAHQGQRYAVKHTINLEFNLLYGGVTILSIPDTRSVLLFTKNSETMLDILKRYVATSVHLHIYFTDKLNLDVDDNAFLTSLAHIRAMHENAAHRCIQRGHPLFNISEYDHKDLDNELWDAFAADLRDSNIPKDQRSFSKLYHEFDENPLPINQFAMAMTIFGSMGYFIMKPKYFFLYDDPDVVDEHLKGIVHLGALMAYSLGIDDEYNIFLQPDVAAARAYFKEIHEKYFNPGYFTLDRPGKYLLQNLVKGYNQLVPFCGAKHILLRILQDLIGIPTPHISALFTTRDKISQDTYNHVFLPFTRRPGFSETYSKVFLVALEPFITAYYGRQPTDMDKAKNVFYNGTAGVSFIEKRRPWWNMGGK